MSSCKICNQTSEYFFNSIVLKKYDVKYFKCINCGFIQTESPYWLKEAYSSAITDIDIGLINRNLYFSPILASLIKIYFNTKARFVDFGGGYGVLTRIMRDMGFDFYRFDIYCENIFVKDFDVKKSIHNNFELLTAFEVFEHLTDPQQELINMLNFSRNIFFSTELRTSEIKSPDDWWYVMPETGQHVSLYTKKSLEILAQNFNLYFYTNGTNLHLFSSKKINPYLFKIFTKYRLAKLLELASSNKRSLLMKDYAMIKAK